MIGPRACRMSHMAEEPTGRAPPNPEKPMAGSSRLEEPSGADGVPGLLARVRDHKIVQWALAYLGAAITIAHGEELLAHAFAWNDGIARGLLAALVAGFPIALGLAWYHGHKGLTRVSQGELLVGSLLLVIAALLLLALVRPAEEVAEPAATAGKSTPAAGIPGKPATAASVPPEPAAAPLRPRIAVLPFENLSPDPQNAFFTDGVHEEILTTLANHAPGVEVISSTTMSTYRGKPVAVQTLAHDLGCTYVLEGSVMREGNEVRLTLQLIDARTDSHLWAQDFDRKLVNAMALEREVAAAVTAQLSVKFEGAVATEGLSSNPLAYDLYLKARAAESAALAAGSLSGLEEAAGLLDRAIDADPRFARAYLERMALHLQEFLYNYVPPAEVLPGARADLTAAERLAPSDPLTIAFAAVMDYVQLDYDRALRTFEVAEAAGLADPQLLDWKDNLLFAMGRYADATALSSRLADLDPMNEDAQKRWVYMLMELHQYREALGLVDSLSVRRPADWRDERYEVLAYAGGDFRPRHAELNPSLQKPWHTAQDVQAHFGLAAMELPLQHRFEEFRQLIDESPVEEWRATYHVWPLYRVGPTPVADERGWMDLLLGDRVQAQRDGERIVAFLKRTPETKWNRWFRVMLLAEAQLFEGNEDAAERSAAEAVTLTRSLPDVSDQMDAYVWSTQILAWTRHKDEAVQRLEQLSTSIPGLWPGYIPAEPKFSVPLEHVAAYQALLARLSEQMQAFALK
jgi:adenylate cyclase